MPAIVEQSYGTGNFILKEKLKNLKINKLGYLKFIAFYVVAFYFKDEL